MRFAQLLLLRLPPASGLLPGSLGMVIAMTLTAAFTRIDPRIAVICNIGFWVSLLLVIRGLAGGMKMLPVFLPFGALYYLTFFWRRAIPDSMGFLLGSDTFRIMHDLAPGRYVEARHLGYTVLTFPFDAIKHALSEYAAMEYLYLETALCGMLAVFLVYILFLRHDVPRWRAYCISALFGVSFAFWTLASAVDTYVVSAMFLAGFLLLLSDYILKPSFRSCLVLALFTAAMLMVSLENLYVLVLPLFAMFVARLQGKRMLRLRLFVLYIGISIAAVTAGIYLAESVIGMQIYETYEDNTARNIVENIARWGNEYLRMENAWSPVQFLKVLYHSFVMAVVAQQNVSSHIYVVESTLLLRRENVLYYAVLLVAAGLTVFGLRRKSDWHSFLLVAVLLLLAAMRHVFMMVFAPDENVLFSLPTIMALWIVVGIGVGGWKGRSRLQSGVLSAVLAVMAALLLAHNLQYLAAIRLP